MTETLVIIPARGNSKGIPRKNLVEFKNRPLISWTMRCSDACKWTTRTVVSTEDQEIADFARNGGVQVVERPRELADDGVHAIRTVLHALDILAESGYEPDYVFMNLPTAPLRRPIHMDESMRVLQDHHAMSVVGVVEAPPIHSMRWIEHGVLGRYQPAEYHLQRQDVTQNYAVNGAIFLSTPRNLRDFQSFHPGAHGYIMSKRSSVDINSWEDLEIAERLY